MQFDVGSGGLGYDEDGGVSIRQMCYHYNFWGFRVFQFQLQCFDLNRSIFWRSSKMSSSHVSVHTLMRILDPKVDVNIVLLFMVLLLVEISVD